MMKNNDKIIRGKNGLRNYNFEEVKNGKSKSYYDQHMGYCIEKFHGMFYTKQCLYCSKDFEARRVDTAFCCQGCQKAHLRLRKINTKI
jgi:hypothetical protein